MAVNTTLTIKEYALGGSAFRFPITFGFTTDDNGDAENIHCQIASKNDKGEYTDSRDLSAGIGGDFHIEGGNVIYEDKEEYSGLYLIIYRNTPVTQLVDFVDNGNFSLEDIEKALDKLTYIIQERTGTPSGIYINIGVSLFMASVLAGVNADEALTSLFSVSGGLKAETQAAIRGAIDSISKSGDENISGVKRFLVSPEVPVPARDYECVNKMYADNQFPLGAEKLLPDCVIEEKLGAGAVTGDKIKDGSIGFGKLAPASVGFSALRVMNTATRSDSGRRDLAISFNVANQIVRSYTVTKAENCAFREMRIVGNTATLYFDTFTEEDSDFKSASASAYLSVIY